MRPNKKADRAMDTLAKMLAMHGVKEEIIEEIKDTPTTTRLAISRQGDAVLLFLESPAKFTAKLCTRCGEAFGTNYRSVGYCSDSCRTKSMFEQLGVKWDYLKSEEERWGGEPPLVIPPHALRKIQEFVQFFADIPRTESQTENLMEQEDQSVVPLQFQQDLSESQSEKHQDKDNSHTIPQILPPVPPQEYKHEEGSPFDFV